MCIFLSFFLSFFLSSCSYGSATFCRISVHSDARKHLALICQSLNTFPNVFFINMHHLYTPACFWYKEQIFGTKRPTQSTKRTTTRYQTTRPCVRSNQTFGYEMTNLGTKRLGYERARYETTCIRMIFFVRDFSVSEFGFESVPDHCLSFYFDVDYEKTESISLHVAFFIGLGRRRSMEKRKAWFF